MTACKSGRARRLAEPWKYVNRPPLLLPAALLASLLALPLPARAADSSTNSATKALIEQATTYDVAGDKQKAADTYEKIVKADPAKGKVLSDRLVKLYAQLGKKEDTLRWAKEVMKDNPDPQAYLAGVYSLLADHKEAESILEKEIAAEKTPHRQLILNWQLADVCEKKGDRDKADKILSAAATAAKGTPDEAAAQQRLDRFGKQKTEEKR